MPNQKEVEDLLHEAITRLHEYTEILITKDEKILNQSVRIRELEDQLEEYHKMLWGQVKGAEVTTDE